jgi:hypothetical protein
MEILKMQTPYANLRDKSKFFGHSQVNVTVSNCPYPIWNGLNLKNCNGQNIHSLLTIADFINFWIEFENLEL